MAGTRRAAADRDGRAHLTTDAAPLLAHDADPLIVVRDGEVEMVTHAESLRHFMESFRGATYHEWNYLEQPTIHIAGDASMAWVISWVSTSWASLTRSPTWRC